MRRLLAPLFAILLFVLPGVSAARTTVSASLAPAFRSDRIIVETRGAGPDIVFIPGLGSTGAAWRSTADKLEGRYRVHLVTIGNFGLTDIGANAGGALAAPAALEIERYIREQRLSRPALIGHSLGGQIALRVAADMRDRIGRVMVVDSAPFFPALVDSRVTAREVATAAGVDVNSVQPRGVAGWRRRRR